MARTRGTCTAPNCQREFDLVDGKIPPHTRPNAWRGGKPIPGMTVPCDGGGVTCTEDRAHATQLARERRAGSVRERKDDALLVLDAYLSGRMLPDMYDGAPLDPQEFVRLAMRMYRTIYPKSRATEPVLMAHRHNRHREFSGRADVFCRVCGELILSNVARYARSIAPIRDHTTVCCLQVVAGMRTMVPPGTMTLPRDHMTDEAAHAPLPEPDYSVR